MSRREAIAVLIEKVEAGDQPQPKDFRAALEVPMQDMRYTQMPNDARAAYGGSIDAAKALHEAVLPKDSTWQYYSGDGSCVVGFGPGPTDYEESHHDNPARAWLLAILRALHAQQED